MPDVGRDRKNINTDFKLGGGGSEGEQDTQRQNYT